MGWLSKWLEPKPYNCGYLPPKDGHEVFFMEFGNPQGLPVIVFTGDREAGAVQNMPPYSILSVIG